jgi:hypothetical protein
LTVVLPGVEVFVFVGFCASVPAWRGALAWLLFVIGGGRERGHFRHASRALTDERPLDTFADAERVTCVW